MDYSSSPERYSSDNYYSSPERSSISAAVSRSVGGPDEHFIVYPTRRKMMTPEEHWKFILKELKRVTEREDWESIIENMCYHHYSRVMYIEGDDPEEKQISDSEGPEGQNLNPPKDNSKKRKHEQDTRKGQACVCKHPIGHVHWIYDALAPKPRYIFPIGSACIRRFPNTPNAMKIKKIAQETERNFMQNMREKGEEETQRIWDYDEEDAGTLFEQMDLLCSELPSFRLSSFFESVRDQYDENGEISSRQMDCVLNIYQNARKCYLGAYGIPWFEYDFPMETYPHEEEEESKTKQEE